MSAFRRGQVGVAADGSWHDAGQHLLGVLGAVVVLLGTGRAPLWLAPAIPLATAVLGPVLARVSPDPAVARRHWREALAAAATVAIAYLALGALLWVGGRNEWTAMVLPFGLLAVPVLTVAWLTLAGMGAARARHGLLLQYPFVPALLRPRPRPTTPT